MVFTRIGEEPTPVVVRLLMTVVVVVVISQPRNTPSQTTSVTSSQTTTVTFKHFIDQTSVFKPGVAVVDLDRLLIIVEHTARVPKPTRRTTLALNSILQMVVPSSAVQPLHQPPPPPVCMRLRAGSLAIGRVDNTRIFPRCI